jgi:hypothetical protein
MAGASALSGSGMTKYMPWNVKRDASVLEVHVSAPSAAGEPCSTSWTSTPVTVSSRQSFPNDSRVRR